MGIDDENYPYERRMAVAEEIDRMKCHVLWDYQQGRPVVLWNHSGFISLMPDTLPEGGIVILCADGSTSTIINKGKI
jgi:hypothetical protein